VLAPFGGEAVLDQETGLVWERSPSNGGFPWHDDVIGGAVDGCYARVVGGRHTTTPPSSAYVVDFADGSLVPWLTGDLARAWCVRGGHGFDVPAP
jgi:hypothetical protein